MFVCTQYLERKLCDWLPPNLQQTYKLGSRSIFEKFFKSIIFLDKNTQNIGFNSFNTILLVGLQLKWGNNCSTMLKVIQKSVLKQRYFGLWTRYRHRPYQTPGWSVNAITAHTHRQNFKRLMLKKRLHCWFWHPCST